MRTLMMCCFLILNFLLAAQVDEGRVIAVESIFSNKDYIQSAELFESLARQGSFSDFYFNAACYWSLAGEKEQAIRCLELAADDGFRFLDWIINEDDLSGLHRYKGWRKIINKVEANKKAYDQKNGKARASTDTLNEVLSPSTVNSEMIELEENKDDF